MGYLWGRREQEAPLLGQQWWGWLSLRLSRCDQLVAGCSPHITARPQPQGCGLVVISCSYLISGGSLWWCNLKARGNPLYLLYSRLFHNLVGTCISFLLLGSKLPQTQQLKITYFLPPCSTEVQVGSTGFSAESHKAKIQMSARLDLI